ncbi:MAG: ISL3 family transposase [Sphaerochaetaceae bacterium]
MIAIAECPVLFQSVHQVNKSLKRSHRADSVIKQITCDNDQIRFSRFDGICNEVQYLSFDLLKDFDRSVAWLATSLSKSSVAEYMRIDWQTVGRCISRTLDDIEPDIKKRLDGLVNIGIDETSYRKGYKYISVIVNHDTNSVVWLHNGHGKSILEKFYEELSEEQRASIKVVTGDGARWITDCVKQYTPDCVRCMDSFHVVEWAMTALDDVRKESWHDANDIVKAIEKGYKASRGRPRADDREAKN